MSYTLGINQYLYRTDICGITDYPFTWSGWVWHNSFDRSSPGTWGSYASSGFSSTTVDGDDWAGQTHTILHRQTTSHGVLHSRNSPATDSEIETSAVGFDLAAWHHVCATFTSSTSRTIYVDGVSIGTDTASIPFDVSQLDITTFGSQRRGIFDVDHWTFGGYVAEVALWDATLGSADIALLAGGRYPNEVDTGNAVGYWPLLTNTRDQVASYHMTRKPWVSKSTAHPDMNSAGAPGKAYNPSPWNGTEEDGAFDFKLTWSDGGDADEYDVYIGTSGSLSLIASGVTNLHYIGDADDFPDDSIVYWRIDSTNDNGTTTGDVWHFDPQVGTATNPTPTSGAGSVSRTQSRLYWDGGKLFQTFDVYIDTVLVESDTTNEYFDLNTWASWPLAYETTYTWYIVSKNVHSEDTGGNWTFTTGADVSASTDENRPGGYDPDLVWDIPTDTWKSVSAASSVSGGGRYKSQIFVLGHKVIYFGDVS